jgi:hypothetical protein
VRALVERQVRDDQPGGVEAAPVAEADEDQVAHRGRDEPGEQGRDRRRSEADAALEEQHASDQRPAEERGDRRERAGGGQHLRLPLGQPGERGDRERDDGPERDDGGLGAEHRAEPERADRGEQDPGGVGDRHDAPSDPLERPVAAVARKEQPCHDHDRRTGDGKPQHQVPRRRRVPERIRQVRPKPVLELVDEGQEERGGQPRRDADQPAEQDEPQVSGAAKLGRVRGVAPSHGRRA